MKHTAKYTDKQIISTYSILGFDSKTGDLGIAVASRAIAVGSIVPFARLTAGLVVSQNVSCSSNGPKGLDLLEAGFTPQEVLDQLLAKDSRREFRQLGIMNARGDVSVFTGENCVEWAGSVTGPGFACVGNTLAGEHVVEAMAETFIRAKGQLWDRLLPALSAGQQAGGDMRGRQAAALVVHRAQSPLFHLDHIIDLRVDDHLAPIDELARLLQRWKTYYLYSEHTKPKAISLIKQIKLRLAHYLLWM